MNNCIKKECDQIDSVTHVVTHGPDDDDDRSHDARNQRIRELNQDIIELNEMTLMINQMIQEHGVQIDNIEKSVEDAKSRIQGVSIELDLMNKQKNLGDKIKYATTGTLCLIASVPLGIYVGTPVGVCTVLVSGIFGALALKKSQSSD
jgi:hypothetical protein